MYPPGEAHIAGAIFYPSSFPVRFPSEGLLPPGVSSQVCSISRLDTMPPGISIIRTQLNFRLPHTWGIIRLPYADPVNPQDVVSNWNADIQPLRCCHSGICRRFIPDKYGRRCYQ